MILLDPGPEISCEEALVMERLVDLVLSLDDRGYVDDRARESVQILGNELHQIGGMSLMLAAYDRIEPLSRFTYVLDSSWDGIGSWAS